uniref:Uncharacterized protein n=1 Tax=Knipowitschia caucasica TaxID=637954 RepID=A0AAV2LPI1_KNICA
MDLRVEQPQVGSPSAPFEETEVRSLSLVRSPRDVLMDVRIALLKYEREKEEREFQLKREIALKRIEAEAVTAREVAFKKIEADAALRMRQLELQSAGRSPVSSSPVVSAPEFDVTQNIPLVPTFRVGAPSCGRTDNTTVYIEKPELITSVSPPPTDKKAGRKFSLAGLVLSCGIPGPTKLLDEVSTEIRQFYPGVFRFLSFMGMVLALAMLLALQRLHFLLGRLVTR